MSRSIYPLALALIILSTHSTIVFNCSTSSSSTASTTTLTRGNSVLFCVHFLPYGIKAAFTLEVDKFTGISVTRAYETMLSSDTDITVQVQDSAALANPTVR